MLTHRLKSGVLSLSLTLWLAQFPSLPSEGAESLVAAPASTKLWASPTETTGEKLDPKSATYAQARAESVKPKGRSSRFDATSLAPLAALRRGASVVIPLLGDDQVTGKVNLVQQEEGGWVRVGGELTGSRAGSFSVGSSGKSVGAMILLPQEEMAYAIEEQPDGKVLMDEKHLSEVICFPMPRPRDAPVAAKREFGPQESLPILSSRPGATAVLYLDFDGETIINQNWNSGDTIDALPSLLTGAQITEVWSGVKEDYWPFNIDVTTDRNRYDTAPAGRRMRCIITPTCSWYKECAVAGVARTDSFAQAGRGDVSSTIPCWAFDNASAKDVAVVVSHELGHTLGLKHDGCTSPKVKEYYPGHGTGAVSWAPIMGAGYDKEIIQWSKGEYAYADNKEDDLAILANAANGFGYVADEAGDSPTSAAVLDLSGSLNLIGIISGTNDVDFYSFKVEASTAVNLTVKPAPISPNLDILLELSNSGGDVLVSSNPDMTLNAAVESTLSAGTYYIKVQGTGRGAVLGDGYSKYGSIGQYLISGTIADATPPVPPTITGQPVSQTVPAGTTVTFPIMVEGTPPFTCRWATNGTLIPYAYETIYTIENVQKEHSGEYFFFVHNAYGVAFGKPFVLTVIFPPTITTQPESKSVKAGDDVRFSVVAKSSSSLTYQWYRNNSPIDLGTAATFVLNGVRSTDAGDYWVRISNDAGAVDSAVAHLTIRHAPIIVAQPRSQTVRQGADVSLAVLADAVPAPTYEWKFKGSHIEGAASSTYTVLDFQPSKEGDYTVVVKNNLGWVVSQPAFLIIGEPPSVKFSRVTLLQAGTMVLNLSGPPGRDLTIYASSDLRSWTPVATVLNPEGTTQFTETIAGKSQTRFYRAIAE